MRVSEYVETALQAAVDRGEPGSFDRLSPGEIELLKKFVSEKLA